MKINFTKHEYRLLLDLLHMADWVMHAHDTEERPENRPYNKLMQKLLANAKEMGFEDLVVFDKRLEEYFITVKFEEETEAATYIDRFQEDNFWESLVSKLAERDVIKDCKAENFYEIELEKRMELLGNAEEKWWRELAEFGLDRMRIDPLMDKTIH
jgi:hypothetical protein